MNVFVERVRKKFSLDLDMDDAVKFAEEMADVTRLHHLNTLSVPAKRKLNLALCFLQTKYPMQCCGKPIAEQCADCPMISWDKKNAASEALEHSTRFLEKNGRPNSSGRPGKPIKLNGRSYPSINAAARELGVHKAVINRMLRDKSDGEKIRLAYLMGTTKGDDVG